jgi:hypothetical protein
LVHVSEECDNESSIPVRVSLGHEWRGRRPYAAVPTRRSCVLASETVDRTIENASINAKTVKTITVRVIATRNKRNTGVRRKPTARVTVITLVTVARREGENICTIGFVDFLCLSLPVRKR